MSGVCWRGWQFRCTRQQFNALPAQQTVVDALKAQNLESGVYIAPFASGADDMSDPESAFMQQHRAGPIVSIYYRKEGAEPMSVGVLAGGLVIDLLAATLAACLLSSVGPCCGNYWCRVGFVLGLGIFVALVGHLSYWNWMYFPLGYTVAFMVDVIVGWSIAGLAIAALIRPPSVQSTSKAVAIESKPVKQVAPQPQRPQPPSATTRSTCLQRCSVRPVWSISSTNRWPITLTLKWVRPRVTCYATVAWSLTGCSNSSRLSNNKKVQTSKYRRAQMPPDTAFPAKQQEPQPRDRWSTTAGKPPSVSCPSGLGRKSRR